MTGCSGRKKEGDEADGDGRGAVSALAVCGGNGHGDFVWGARMDVGGGSFDRVARAACVSGGDGTWFARCFFGYCSYGEFQDVAVAGIYGGGNGGCVGDGLCVAAWGGYGGLYGSGERFRVLFVVVDADTAVQDACGGGGCGHFAGFDGVVGQYYPRACGSDAVCIRVEERSWGDGDIVGRSQLDGRLSAFDSV